MQVPSFATSKAFWGGVLAAVGGYLTGAIATPQDLLRAIISLTGG